MIQLSRRLLSSLLKCKQFRYSNTKHCYHATRTCTTSSESQHSVFYLKSRSLVEVTGRDTTNFLQGLITSDVTLLNAENTAQYSMMLNVQGRVMYDMILYLIPASQTTDTTIWLECSTDIKHDLIQTLKKYKIRKKVSVNDISDKINIYCSQKNNIAAQTEQIKCIISDPRIQELGHRILLDGTFNAGNNSINIEDEIKYTELRYRLGIGEGTTDHPPGSTFPLESNLIFLNGVSFDKGCYIGQELTARTYHTGVTRKRLMPLIFHSDTVNVETGTSIISEKGKSVGKFRNAVNQYGLGLMRVAEAKGPLSVTDRNGEKLICTADKPSWWPTANHDL